MGAALARAERMLSNCTRTGRLGPLIRTHRCGTIEKAVCSHSEVGRAELASPTGYRTRIRALNTRSSSRSTTMDWRDKAACLTVDPELFFPVGNTGPAVDQIEKAKSVCARCTVTEICLQYALETGQDSGVWGGLSEDERRALKRRAARARRAS